MQELPPITAEAPAEPRPFARSIYSPRTRASYATYRLFHGEEPATLSVKDQVAVAVAERIVEQRLKPGQRISEQSIADEFNVSKAPVSEALILLEHTGLVESAARRSAHVTRMNASDLDELIEIREALEGVVFPRFIDRHTLRDREVLRDYLAMMKDLALDDARTFEFVEAADRSILFISIQAGNRRVARTMSPLSLQMLRYLAIGFRAAKQRKQLLGWWSDALKLFEARNVGKFMEFAAQTRGTIVAEVRAALRAMP